MTSDLISISPWDKAAFGLFAGELTEYSEAALAEAAATPGIYSIKIDPLADKALLHKYGFYYCDTLIEPCCTKENFKCFSHSSASITHQPGLSDLLGICHGSFSHGRFHRDFNLPRNAADLRYDNWLGQLHAQGEVYGLLWQGEIAGFIACHDNCLVLHSVADAYRGKGLAKYWWSLVCREMFDSGHAVLQSSISAANLAVLNLYGSLGFRFKSVKDVYHRVARP